MTAKVKAPVSSAEEELPVPFIPAAADPNADLDPMPAVADGEPIAASEPGSRAEVKGAKVAS